MDCYICGKKYKSWIGLFYHQPKIHNSVNARSSRYEYEIKNALKLAEEKAGKCMFCARRYCKGTMEEAP